MRELLERMMQMTGQRPQVLLVDDDPLTAKVLQAILQHRVDLAVAATPAAALELCQLAPPDLLLLDIDLGGEDGFALCRHIKQQPALAGIPVIFITASHDEADEERAFKLGAVDFIRKPVSPYIAEARVLTHLALQLQAALLRRVAHSDSLTGLKNRRSVDEELERDWKECARAAWPLSIIMLDIDHFKRYNDCYGHPAGDACLRQVASVIHATFCRPGDCAARYGGEEFICILPNTDFAGALALAQHIRAAIAALGIAHREGGSGGHVSASVGVATAYPDASEGWPALLAAADQQLYRAKESGRDRVCGQQRSAGTPTGPVAAR